MNGDKIIKGIIAILAGILGLYAIEHLFAGIIGMGIAIIIISFLEKESAK